MSQAGNIKGPSGATWGQGLPRLTEGGVTDPSSDKAPPESAVAREEKTRISKQIHGKGKGKDAPRPETAPRETRGTGMWNSTDAVEFGDDPRSDKGREPWDSGFEGPRNRGTGERPRVRSGEDRAAGTFEGPRGQDGTRGTGERPRVPSRPGEDRAAGTFEGPRGQDGTRGTGGRPALRPRPEGGESALRFDAPFTSPRPGRPVGEGALMDVPFFPPEVPADADGARPLDELLPMFPEAIGQDALAHHFQEELLFASADLRPMTMPRSTRAQRLWAFFIAYAEANARDPWGQSLSGRASFRDTLSAQGFAELHDVPTGRDGVEVALGLLEAQSPEELKAQLASLQMEARPEPAHTEGPLPVQAQAEAPAEETPEAEAEAEPQDAEETPDTPARPRDARSTQAERKAEPPRTPVPEQAERKAETPKSPGVDQAEPETLRGAAQAVAPGTPQAVVLPQLASRLEPGAEATPEELAGKKERTTSKRLGSQMLWNALHTFRDSAENDAVKRERWSQLAFGAIAFLMVAAALIGLLISL